MAKPTESLHNQSPRILALGICSPTNFTKDVQSYFDEFINLVTSNGIEYYAAHCIKLRAIDPAYFITKGKLDELVAYCAKENIQEVIVSEPLKVTQERNLSKILNCRVFDRTQLILEIFEKGAHSAEGKIQVALAMLQHKKSRLVGAGISMSQQQGSIGQRGPGETQKENEIHHIEHLMNKLRRDLKQLAQVRETQRKQRLTQNIPHVCLIGYTNAGKSSILNALTHSDVLAEDRLFATLDTTTRELFIDSKKKGVISDTVGFIQQLPHHLVEAFKSTLTELQYAHVLLQVIDASDKNWESHIMVVRNILEELGVNKPMLYVFNKIDKVEHPALLEQAVQKYQPHVLVSTVSEHGLDPLIDYLRTWKP